MTKLLISGVGGSLFPYLFDKLNKTYELIFVDSNPLVKKLYPNENIYIVPLVNDNNYESAIIDIIHKNKIDFYIPLIDEEIIKAINISKKIDVNILAPCENFVKLTLNKYKLMRDLSTTGISSIETFMCNSFSDEIDYPLFLKPNVGRGSRGVKKVNSKKELDAYFVLEKYTQDEILVQPYIGGKEYTVSVTVNNLNQLISIIPKLVLTKEGITKHAISVKHEQIEETCKKIVQIYKPCGSFNVQLKVYNSKIYIFEINPRYSTTLVLSIQSGINEIDLNIKYFNKQNVSYIKDFKEITLIRRWENCFYE